MSGTRWPQPPLDLHATGERQILSGLAQQKHVAPQRAARKKSSSQDPPPLPCPRRIAEEFADAEPARLAEVDRLAADLPVERIELTSRDEPL